MEAKQKNETQKEETKEEIKIVQEKVETQNEKNNKKRDKKNKNEVEEKGVIFKVQIATSSNKIELKPENFNGVEDVAIYEAGGLYRYTVGKESNMVDANRLQLQLRTKGFKDAFIIAFSDGKRIPVSSALNLQK